MASPLNPFARACAEAVATALDMAPDAFTVSAPPRRELGDFAVGCFPAAKEKRAAPPKIAAEVVGAFSPTDLLASAEATGPFVNFRIQREALFRHLASGALTDDGEMIPTTIGAGKTICIDYSSPNVSKHLAYHHIRSTGIGHALANLYRAVGYRVVGINHLGDWGTTHGMILAAIERWGMPDPLTIEALNSYYVRFNDEIKQNPDLKDLGQAWFVRLEAGDEVARARWQKFREVSWLEFEEVYQTLGIRFEEVRGESEFEDAMDGVLELFENKKLAEKSQGAIVVQVKENDEDNTPPLMLVKSDGGTTYGTRDVAAAIYRWETYGFERSLYVVGRAQGLHFKQLFRALSLAGFEWAERCAHIGFGMIRFGGVKMRGRTGNVILLKEVLEEATRLAGEKIRENNPDMNDEDFARTARQVGVGAVVFANVASARNSDIDFNWDEVLSLQGDTGPYLQYGHARCKNIERKGDEMGTAANLEADLSLLGTDLEWALALRLSEFPDHVARAADGNDPHIVARYLLDVVSAFSRWYTEGNSDRAARVLCEDLPTRAARLTLTAIVAKTIATGLALLGVEAPAAM